MKASAYLAILFASLAPSLLLAQESGATVDVTFGTKYVFRGLQHGDDTWHPTIELYGNDFYAGLWGAIPLESRGYPDYFDDEYDFYAGYGWALNKDTAVDVGVTYYYFPNGDRDSLEGYLGLSRELGTFTPSVYVYRDFDLDTFTFQLSTDFAVPMESFPLQLSAFVGRVEADESPSYNYFGADVVYPIELNDATTVSFGLHYSDHDYGRGRADQHLYGTASITIDF